MEWLPTKHIQSVSILKKNNLRWAIVLSKSSKHRLLLSRQMHHIKQWGTAIQITPLWWRLNLHKYFNRYRITYSLIFKITITNYTNQLYLKSPPPLPQTPFHKEKGFIKIKKMIGFPYLSSLIHLFLQFTLHEFCYLKKYLISIVQFIIRVKVES